MRDFRLVVDMVNTELDAMLDAVRLDDRHPDRVGITAGMLTAEDITHRQNGFQRVALGAARRRHIGFAARHPNAVVEDGVDGFGREPVGVVLDCDRAGTDDDFDHRSDFGFLTGIKRIVDKFFEHNQGPIIDRVPGLILQFPFGAEFHEPRHLEDYSGQFSASGPVRLCHNL